MKKSFDLKTQSSILFAGRFIYNLFYMQTYVDPRIQKDATLLQETIAALTEKIEENRRTLSNLEATLKEQELKLATILPYTVPLLEKNMSTTIIGSSEKFDREQLRDALLNLLRIKGAMRSSLISKALGDGTKIRNNRIHNMLKTLITQGLIKKFNHLPTGEIIERDYVYNII